MHNISVFSLQMYYDVLTESEIKVVKNLATPRLKRATVGNVQTGAQAPSHYRISKSAWLQDHEDALVDRISQRSGAIANLTLETVEELQVRYRKT